MYKVEWSKKAKKSLGQLDRIKAKKITNKVENYLAVNPQERGEPLTSNLKGQ